MAKIPASQTTWPLLLIFIFYPHSSLSVSCLLEFQPLSAQPSPQPRNFHKFTCPCAQLSSSVPYPGKSSSFRTLELYLILFYLILLPCITARKFSQAKKHSQSCVFPFSRGSQSTACYPVLERNCLIYLSSFIVVFSERASLILVTV